MVDTAAVVKHDTLYIQGNSTICIVAPNPAPTQEEAEKILADYRSASLEIWKEQLLQKEVVT